MHLLEARVKAMDRLEAYLLDASLDPESRRRAKARYARLESANSRLYESIRQEIQQGIVPAILLETSGNPQPDGYDYLDELLIGILQFPEPAGILPLESEMVFYQPTPARHIFDLIHRTSLTDRDVLVDLGSGLGHVPLLASICTRARAIGIELDPAYVSCARHSAQHLNLTRAEFIHQDARHADLSTGTVFYLYTPFTGSILRTVLDSLKREATRRPIRIATFGPCTPTVAQELWLDSIPPYAPTSIALFRSRPRDTADRCHSPTEHQTRGPLENGD